MSVRNALLGLLAQQPRHGYELHAAFEAVVGGKQNWDVKPAQIYTTLTRLEASGLVRQEGVEQEGGPEKRIYALTEEGRNELEQWLTSAIERGHQRDELFLKLMLSLATGQGGPSHLLQRQRAGLYQELHALTLQRNRADPRRELAQVLLFDKAIMHLEADLRWIEIVEARLSEIVRQPLPEPPVKPRGRPPKRSTD
ncbi:MAG: PadR family transcriptional regulator [Ardenticatenales bacterium]|nr:PadR family transcriptional regulator [Ardenticatenales bacterium]